MSLRDLIDRGKGARPTPDPRRPGQRASSPAARLADEDTAVIGGSSDHDFGSDDSRVSHADEPVRHPIVEPVSQLPSDESSPHFAPSSGRVSSLAATSGYHVTPSGESLQREESLQRAESLQREESLSQDEDHTRRAGAPPRVVRPGSGSASQETVYAAIPELPHPVGVLVVVEGQPEGAVFTVYPGDTTIGREVDNDVRLTPLQISRHHATLRNQEGVFWLEAQASENETAVNGEQLDEAREIFDGDLLQFARTRLRFRTIQGL